jgi:hypothetical protein
MNLVREDRLSFKSDVLYHQALRKAAREDQEEITEGGEGR